MTTYNERLLEGINSDYERRFPPVTLDEVIAHEEQELIAHLQGQCEQYCSHCHETFEIRRLELGIEDLNLYEDYCLRFAEED